MDIYWRTHVRRVGTNRLPRTSVPTLCYFWKKLRGIASAMAL